MSPSGPTASTRAALLIVTAMAMMGFVDNIVVIIAETAGLWQFQVIRTAMALALLTALARWRGWRLRPRRWALVLARSAVQSGALILYFAALALLPIAEAVAGLFTAPIFVLLMSVAIYGHPVGPRGIAAALIGFAGVVLVLRPDAGAVTPLSLLPVAAGFLYAVAALATREWCEGEAAGTLLFGFFTGMGAWGLIGLAVLSVVPVVAESGPEGFPLRLWGTMSAAAWAGTVAQAVFSVAAVGLIIRAYQIGAAAQVAVYEYALLAFAVFWGWVLFRDPVDGWTLVGIAAIVFSGAVIAGRDRPRPTRSRA